MTSHIAGHHHVQLCLHRNIRSRVRDLSNRSSVSRRRSIDHSTRLPHRCTKGLDPFVIKVLQRIDIDALFRRIREDDRSSSGESDTDKSGGNVVCGGHGERSKGSETVGSDKLKKLRRTKTRNSSTIKIVSTMLKLLNNQPVRPLA